MNILTEIYRSPGVNTNGKTIHRTAVRGVILRERNLLLVHAANAGDYKFPGGGVMESETHAQSLCREIREECGMSVTHVGAEIGAIVEYNIPIEKDYDVFKMTSHYYHCEVAEGSGVQNLDDYERELGFKPVWIDIEAVLRINTALLHSGKTIEWLRREIFMLEHIRHNILLNT